MSCNLPVVSTRFGALPRIFDDGDGLFFADGRQDLVEAVGRVRAGSVQSRTRAKVLPYSWAHVVERLAAAYGELAEQPR
jgi:glycosyltransferase involved in cell wall biosynthesis